MEATSASGRVGRTGSAPRSPTLSLSEISMLLPEGDTVRSISPPLYTQQLPPSPPDFYSHSNRSEHTIRQSSTPKGRRGPPLQTKSPPLSTQSSRSTLRRMNDSALASSPTVDDSFLSPHMNDYEPSSQHRVSSGSSSVCSEDFEDMKRWPGFDSHGAYDDSGVHLDDDDDENHDQFPVGGHGDDDDHWGDDDNYSSDLYSKRAEMILANAKKRLNVMEGNLRGARKSLVVSPTLTSPKYTPDLSQQISVARERDRELYAGIGPIPPRTRPYNSSPLSLKTSPAHIRGLSETAVPLPFASPTYMSRILPNKRSTSAMGQASGPWSPESYGNGRFPIRETRSFEAARDPKGTGVRDDQNHPLRSHSRNSISPVLETLHEEAASNRASLRRSSTTDGLRDQMNDLKGRISSLKLRAQEDHMRRRSLQSLRTPSPFTSAETWYSDADGYKNSTSPIADDAGVGTTMQSPTRKAFYEDESSDSTPKEKPARISQRHQSYHAEIDTVSTVSEDDYRAPVEEDQDPEPTAFHYDDTHLGASDAEDNEEQDDAEGSDNDFVSVYGDEHDGSSSSVYEDAVYEMPVTERHEDRIDAFDYENFFLHSAMGAYSSGRRGSDSSTSSGDSVATTRPVTAIDNHKSPKRASMHDRNSSVDSVSTIASFATAVEDQWDEDEENEAMDHFSEQILPNHHSTTQRHITHLTPIPQSPRSDSGAALGKSPSSSSLSQRSSSRGSLASSELMTSGLQTSKIFSILSNAPIEGPRIALNEEEKQLIYSLAASFQQVCAGLQNTSADMYERKEARRRMDQARRILNGEAPEGLPF